MRHEVEVTVIRMGDAIVDDGPSSAVLRAVGFFRIAWIHAYRAKITSAIVEGTGCSELTNVMSLATDDVDDMRVASRF